MKSFLKTFAAVAIIASVAFWIYSIKSGSQKKTSLEPTPQPVAAAHEEPPTPTPGPKPSTPAPVVEVAAVPATPAPTPNPNDPQEILRTLPLTPKEWPQQVALKKEHEFQVKMNGNVLGHFALHPGSAVSVVAVHPGKVVVSSQGSSVEIDAADTDIVERVIYRRTHPLATPIAAVASAATPSSATPPSASPAPATPASSLLAQAQDSGMGGSDSKDRVIMGVKTPPHVNYTPEVEAIVKEAESMSPTVQKPFKFEKDDTETPEHWKTVAEKYMSIPANEVMAHPAANDFPGPVPDDAPRLRRTLTFPMNLPRWQSTGLYAAPGERITVRVSSQDAARGLSIVIGSQSDKIYKTGKWPRFPQINRSFKVTEPVTTVANAFGGLIYVNIPREKGLGGYQIPTFGGYGWLDEKPHNVAGNIRVVIEGGVESPLYQLGKTSPEEWHRQLESSKAPWGELASDRVILTLPSKLIKTVNNPAPLLEYWAKVIDAEAQLAGWKQQPAPPERIVPDREISAGWMHSAYPVMIHIVSAPELIDLEKLKTEGDWGFFHELGHNHEAQAATFGSDYTEVNVNFFSLYVMENIVKRTSPGHGAIKDVDKLLRERLGSEHNTDAFHNLAMYILPIHALGWDAFQKTLASYATPEGIKGISSREEKMDQWVRRYSKATGKNLAPYFSAFDVTCSDATKEALKDLPVWVPDPKFPQNYGGAAPVVDPKMNGVTGKTQAAMQPGQS